MKILLIVITAFICLIGLSEVLHSFKLSLLKPKNSTNKVMLCLLKDATAELDLQFIIEQANWHGNKFVDRIVCINHIKSQETLSRCEQIAKLNNIKIILENELINLIKSE